MIEQTATSGALQSAQHARQGKVLTMVQNERMAGSIPKWDAPATAKTQVEQNLAGAQSGKTVQASGFQSALAAQNQSYSAQNQEEFTFGDLVDMVNPLHHLPVVGTLYRGATGDEIKPIGRIIGGAVFGGPIGAASSLVNTVVEAETGKDLAGNALSFVAGERNNAAAFETPSENPEKRLEQATAIAKAEDDLPASLLSFTDSNKSDFRAERFSHFKSLHNQSMREIETMPDLPPREEITKLAAFSMR